MVATLANIIDITGEHFGLYFGLVQLPERLILIMFHYLLSGYTCVRLIIS